MSPAEKSPAEDPRVLALSRQADRAVHAAEQAAARVDTLDESLATIGRKVDELREDFSRLDQDVAGLAQDVAGIAPRGGQVWSWFLVDDPELASALLADLAGWLDGVYLRYPAATLSSCWLWHPAVVEELLVLRHLHAAAYDSKSWTNPATWQNQWLPGVQERVDGEVGTCRLRKHAPRVDRELGTCLPQPAQPDGFQVRKPRVAPMVQHLSAVVDAWIPDRLLPEPTVEQLRDADEYDLSTASS